MKSVLLGFIGLVDFGNNGRRAFDPPTHHAENQFEVGRGHFRPQAVPASLPRTPREWPTDPIGPPRRSRSTPDVLPPPIRAGSAATVGLDQEGTAGSTSA